MSHHKHKAGAGDDKSDGERRGRVLPNRVADYFVIVGVNDDPSPAESKRRFGGGNKLPIKVLDRYPKVDHSDAEFPKDLPLFNFPGGVYLHAAEKPPETFTFALTEADGTRVYGCCFHFYEKLPANSKLIDSKFVSSLMGGAAGAAVAAAVTASAGAPDRSGTPTKGIDGGSSGGGGNVSRAASAETINKQSTAPASNKPTAAGGAVAGGTLGSGQQPPTPAKGKLPAVTESKLVDASTPASFSPFPAVEAKSTPSNLRWVPISICVTSHWPFYEQFETFLTQLYRQTVDQQLTVPIERVISNFIHEIPLPPPGRIEVEYKSLNSKNGQIFKRPPPNKGPLRDSPLSHLFRYLSVENIMILYGAVALERRILFVSSHLNRLCQSADAICHLLIPLFWRHIFIPVLPIQLTDFISAPMPFIVGVHTSYLPDDLLLDAVVVVDLDQNVIKCTETDPIEPLPEKRLDTMLKALRKLVGGDSTIPITDAFKLDDDAVMDVFLKYHAKVLKSYRDYLEAPSDLVVDKFDKAKFVNEHAEKCKFLTDFMDTQMFQCFVDDRYEGGAGTKTKDLEVLFFDEYIDQHINNRQAPFLNDTSQAHNKGNRFVCLTPNKDNLPKSNLKYLTFPTRLDHGLFGTARAVKPLVSKDEEAAVQNNKMDMSKLSMKFFTEKRLYSQHFHSLRLRSSKQDLAFKDITTYLKHVQGHDEADLQALETMCHATVTNDTVETATTIDGAWASVKKFALEQTLLHGEAFRAIREETCIPLYETSLSCEHQLKILFQEAHVLEQKAGQGKATVERAKARAVKAQLKYDNMRRGFAPATTGDIHKLVMSQHESETANLDLDESEVFFQTVVLEYEKRMPEIIKAIRKLNTQRIERYKSSMTKWAASQRRLLVGMMKNLDEVDKHITGIDVEKDIKSFSEGAQDVWGLNRMRSSSALPGAEQQFLDGKIEPMPEDSVPDPLPVTPKTTNAANSTAAIAVTVTAPGTPTPAAPATAATAVATSTTAATANSTATNNSLATPAASTTTSGVSPAMSPLSPSTVLIPASNGALKSSAYELQFMAHVPGWSPAHSAGWIGIAGATSKEDFDEPTGPAPHRALLSYTMQLWGIDGWAKALEQAVASKHMYKEAIAAFDEVGNIVTAASKKLESAVKNTPDSTVVGLESTQRKVWELMRVRVTAQSKAYGDFGSMMTKLVANLKIAKGEMKYSHKRFADHRIKLERELQAATEFLLRAHEARSRVRTMFEVAESTHKLSTTPAALAMTQMQLERHSSKMDKATREMKETEHLYTMAERSRRAIQTKHDVTIGRMLSLLEYKEKRLGSELRKSFAIVAAGWKLFLGKTCARADENLLAAIKAVDVYKDIREWVSGSVKEYKRAPDAPVLAPPSADPKTYDYNTLLDLIGFDIAFKHTDGQVNVAKAWISLLEEKAAADEATAKAMRKFDFHVKSCTFASLNEAFSAFTAAMEGLTVLTESTLKNAREVSVKGIDKLRKEVKADMKNKERDYTDVQSKYKAAVAAKDAAVVEESKLLAASQAAAVRVRQAEEEANKTPNKKATGGIFSWGGSTVEGLKTKAKEAEKAHLNAKEMRVRKEQQLAEMEKDRVKSVSAILRKIRELEEQRAQTMVTILQKHVTSDIASHENLLKQMKTFAIRTRCADMDRDIDAFLTTKRAFDAQPPACVIDDYRRTLTVADMKNAPRDSKSNIPPPMSVAGAGTVVVTPQALRRESLKYKPGMAITPTASAVAAAAAASSASTTATPTTASAVTSPASSVSSSASTSTVASPSARQSIIGDIVPAPLARTGSATKLPLNQPPPPAVPPPAALLAQLNAAATTTAAPTASTPSPSAASTSASTTTATAVPASGTPSPSSASAGLTVTASAIAAGIVAAAASLDDGDDTPPPPPDRLRTESAAVSSVPPPIPARPGASGGHLDAHPSSGGDDHHDDGVVVSMSVLTDDEGDDAPPPPAAGSPPVGGSALSDSGAAAAPVSRPPIIRHSQALEAPASVLAATASSAPPVAPHIEPVVVPEDLH